MVIPSGSKPSEKSLRFAYTLTALVLVIAIWRIVKVDGARPQGFDEPAHVAAGMEWLQFHTYRLDPLHPPVGRLATAGLLYLSGVRFRETNSASLPQFWDAGNSILYQGDYLHNLFLARIGILPFFAMMLITVFVWTRRQFGEFAALMAVMLLSTLPVILSFSSLAYTDFPAACLQLCCILAFAEWLDRRSLASSAALGALFGLAVLTKFTSLLYIPLAAAAILLSRFYCANKPSNGTRHASLSLRVALAALTAILVTWGGYRFSVGPIDEALGISKQPMPSFQHFPGPLRGIARESISSDWRIPAPSLFAGLAQVWVLNKSRPDAYLFQKFKPGGWWYFFLVDALFKTPIPFLIFVAVGCRSFYGWVLARDWKPLVPLLAALSILLFTTTVSIDSGLRHILVVFPFLAMIAGGGAQKLWDLPKKVYVGKAALVVMLGWQCATTLRPGTDWISYFNGLAGKDPSKIIISGCDLDCGQDVLNLSEELRRRSAKDVALALWTSADLQKMNLPQFSVLEPFQPRSGWVAVSARAMREGSVQHKGYPPGAFSWLDQHRPVAQIGSTIRLYYLPDAHESAEPDFLRDGNG